MFWFQMAIPLFKARLDSHQYLNIIVIVHLRLLLFFASDTMAASRSRTADESQETNTEDQPGKKNWGSSAARGRARGGKSGNATSAPRSALASITGPTNNARQAAAADSLGSEYEKTLEQRLEDLQSECL